MTDQDILTVKVLLSTPKRIVIVPHKNPDGDAIGSTLGFYHYLNRFNHTTTVISPNNYPEFLKWIPGESSILKYDEKKKLCDTLINDAEIIFTLDFNNLDRSGLMSPALSKSSAVKIMIDHHQQPEDYATVLYSDPDMSSTCEMVYHFIKMLGDGNKIDSDIATCLYVGIMTDTGSFRFPSTTSTTHRVIANLIEKGAKNSEIHQQLYDTNSFNRLQLLGVALKNLEIIPEFRTAYIRLSQEELDTHNFRKGDAEGFVNYGLSIENIIFAAIFIENTKENIIKISLRSKGDFSVNEFSRTHFNGGGHTNAAGGVSTLGLEETITYFLNVLSQYKLALAK